MLAIRTGDFVSNKRCQCTPSFGHHLGKAVKLGALMVERYNPVCQEIKEIPHGCLASHDKLYQALDKHRVNRSFLSSFTAGRACNSPGDNDGVFTLITAWVFSCA